ncbi:hypothetical protein Glove_268g2 [Diversispora epigaea]|uniref:Uncharacterized protein n=1 Tax=Diversispora epigaea TaxID=1348612 RepID=A0A397I716_9GLOM|nr:hypothetical protein Glove_268g2 [Diversispora epigaea]
MSRMRNRSIFASAIAGLPAFTIPSTSIASRHTRPETEPTAPFVVEEEEEREATRKKINVSESYMKRLIAKINSLDKKMYSLLKEQIDIKKRLKNIELLSEINNDPNFSKDVITRVTTNIFKVNIFPSEKNLKEETESVIRKSFPDIYESMDSRHHSSFFKKIKTKLLEKLREMRGGIASRGVAIAQLFLNPKEEEKRSPKRRRTSGGRVLSPRLGSPRLGSGSPRLASSRLVSPRLASSRLASSQSVSPRHVSPRPVSPRLFESPDTPDTTQEEGDTTGGDTEGAEIVGQ